MRGRLAYFEWNPNGWLFKLGVYDFAGSGPVHIASGFGALAWSLMLGPRVRDDEDHDSGDDAGTKRGRWRRRRRAPHYKPHSTILVAFGTVMIWFGWFAFNGASTANLSLRSIYAVLNTNLAACGGGVAWAVLEYVCERDGVGRRRFSIVGFCTGVIAGLVGITPAAGFVPVYTSALIGVVTACVCFFAVRYQHLLCASLDDGLDIFAVHGVGGVVGDVLTGVFAARWVPALDGVSGDLYAGGWWERHWVQLGYQLAAACTCAAWSFVVSCILLFIIGRIPGMRLRADEDDERRGLDYAYLRDVDAEAYAVEFGARSAPALVGVAPLDASDRSSAPTVTAPSKMD